MSSPKKDGARNRLLQPVPQPGRCQRQVLLKADATRPGLPVAELPAEIIRQLEAGEKSWKICGRGWLFQPIWSSISMGNWEKYYIYICIYIQFGEYGDVSCPDKPEAMCTKVYKYAVEPMGRILMGAACCTSATDIKYITIFGQWPRKISTYINFEWSELTRKARRWYDGKFESCKVSSTSRGSQEPIRLGHGQAPQLLRISSLSDKSHNSSGI